MSIHTINHSHAVLSPQTQAAKPVPTPASASSFLDVLGSHLPKTGTPVATTPSTGFAALFSNYSSLANPNPPGPSQPAPFVPSYEQGAYVTNTDGSRTPLNPLELATSSTASDVAQLLGGTVVNASMNGGYATSVPTRQISIPGSNVQINAGLAANLFATYGTAAGSQAWQIINRDLGVALNPARIVS